MPSIKLDDIFRRFAANARHFERASPGQRFAEAAREATGTPDTYLDYDGKKKNIASADYGSTPFMLGDVYAGVETVKNWGPQALPDMVRLEDARAMGWHPERLLASQPLTPALSEKIVDAVVKTDDVKQASRLFGAMLNNPSLPVDHKLALIDWTLRRTESRDVVDPSTGKLVRPKLSQPPRAEELVARLEAQANPSLRAFAPVLAKQAGLTGDRLKRAVLVAMADPNPVVREAAAPYLNDVAPPDRQRLEDLTLAFFSKDAKAKLRRGIEAEVGPLPTSPDLEGDVLPQGDFYPQRMEAAGEFQAEFLGTMLRTSPPGANLEWLIGEAPAHARGNPGLIADLFAALRRTGATPAERADLVVKLNDYSDGGYVFLSQECLRLVAADPSLAEKLKGFLSPEIVAAAPGARRDVLKKTDDGLTALLREKAITLADVLPRIDAQPVGAGLLKAALDAGAKPEVLLRGVVKNLGDHTDRQTFLAALALLPQAHLPSGELDQTMAKLMGAKALTYYGVNDVDTRGIPGPPMPGDPVDPAFPPPQGTVSQALLKVWMADQPTTGRAEHVYTEALAATDPDRKAWLGREFVWAGAKSPALDQLRTDGWQKLKADAMAHASNIGDYIEPSTGSAPLGDIEADLVAAARTEFLAFKPDAAPAIDVNGALTAARAAPPATRLQTFWDQVSASGSDSIKQLNAPSAIALAYQLPEAQARPLVNELATFEADRITAGPQYSRFREGWGTAAGALFNNRGSATLLTDQTVIAFATRVPELKPMISLWLASPAAASVRAAVIAALPDLATPPPAQPYLGSRPFEKPPLPGLADTAALKTELTARLAALNDVNARLAARPNDNALFFEQSDVSRNYFSEVFKLSETKDIASLSAADLKPFADSLGEAGPTFELAAALNRGVGYAALAAQFKGVGAFDWDGAEAVNRQSGPEAALGHLLLSGEQMSNPKADDTSTSIALAAAGRAKAPEALRQKMLIDGLFTDPLPALKGVALWNGPSLTWALPALTELMAGTDVENHDYVGQLGSILPQVMQDPRLTNDQVVNLVVGALGAMASGQGWRDISSNEELAPAPIVAAALGRPGLTADERKTLINAAVYSGRWTELRPVLSASEYQKLADHVLARTWKTPLKPIDQTLDSLLRSSEFRATLPPDASGGMI